MIGVREVLPIVQADRNPAKAKHCMTMIRERVLTPLQGADIGKRIRIYRNLLASRQT